MSEQSLFERIYFAHERLKRRIHQFRVPIHNKFGLFGVGLVYFSVPCIAGYFIMGWTEKIARENLGENNEKLLLAKSRWVGENSDVPRLYRKVTPEPRAPPVSQNATKDAVLE